MNVGWAEVSYLHRLPGNRAMFFKDTLFSLS